jgi:hypothetical protein
MLPNSVLKTFPQLYFRDVTHNLYREISLSKSGTMQARPTINSQSNRPNPTTPFPKREIRDHDHDLATLRTNLKSLVVKNLLTSPFLTKFYVDSVIHNFPNSNAAKLLARNYQKIIDRITMPNPKSCTHIKVTGARCESPALRGEQFCYFHQHAHRGVRRPSRSRLHPIALIESEEAIQASLMEVINGLLRNTIDLKRAELILRALHIAVKNARRTKFDASQPVREIPEYAAPPAKAVPDAETEAATPEPELDMPYTAAIPLQPSREERAEREHQAKLELERARQATVRAQLERARKTVANGDSSPVSQAASPQRLANSSECSKGGNETVDPSKPKPPVSVKKQPVTAQSKTASAPKERKNAAQRASAG